MRFWYTSSVAKFVHSPFPGSERKFSTAFGVESSGDSMDLKSSDLKSDLLAWKEWEGTT